MQLKQLEWVVVQSLPIPSCNNKNIQPAAPRLVSNWICRLEPCAHPLNDQESLVRFEYFLSSTKTKTQKVELMTAESAVVRLSLLYGLEPGDLLEYSFGLLRRMWDESCLTIF